MNLTNDLAQPLKCGNVTLKTAGGPAGISMYGLYLSGNEVDLTVTGKSHICELMMTGGGKLKVFGTPGENEISIGCTTLELGGTADMQVQHVHMGRPLTWQAENNIGEANVKGSARLHGENISVRNVRFRTEDKGQVDLNAIEKHGSLESKQEGGTIRVNESVEQR